MAAAGGGAAAAQLDHDGVGTGRLDPGETPEACARRELEEETGIPARLVTIVAPR